MELTEGIVLRQFCLAFFRSKSFKIEVQYLSVLVPIYLHVPSCAIESIKYKCSGGIHCWRWKLISLRNMITSCYITRRHDPVCHAVLSNLPQPFKHYVKVTTFCPVFRIPEIVLHLAGSQTSPVCSSGNLTF
jgi:hypothetical protein